MLTVPIYSMATALTFLRPFVSYVPTRPPVAAYAAFVRFGSVLARQACQEADGNVNQDPERSRASYPERLSNLRRPQRDLYPRLRASTQTTCGAFVKRFEHLDNVPDVGASESIALHGMAPHLDESNSQ